MRVLIIDDEPPARELLASMLGAHPQVEIVGEAGHLEEARALCQKHRPAVLFLDIEMGVDNGFSLLDGLESPRPVVVFVTAHDDFTIAAFDADAVDYLLKPVNPARLAQTIEKLKRYLGLEQANETLSVRTDKGFATFSLHSITHIEADENYTRVYLGNGETLYVRRTVQTWESLLPSERFVRVHRSLIINLNAVATLRNDSRDAGEVALAGCDTPIPLARRALQKLRRLLS